MSTSVSAAEYSAPVETLGTVAARHPRHHRMSLVRKVTNLPIRVPSSDWAAVVTGRKQMFRTYGPGFDRERPVVPADTECPRPCLLFTERQVGAERQRQWRAVPGVLLAHRQEPLGSITPEDLAKEGRHFLPAFRYYWRDRYRNLGWRPWEMVSVLEVQPLDIEDEQWGLWALKQLYGEWLPE